jgi:hypothetical protein
MNVSKEYQVCSCCNQKKMHWLNYGKGYRFLTEIQGTVLLDAVLGFFLLLILPHFFCVIFASTFQDMKTTSSNCFFVTMQLHFSTLQSLLESRIFFLKFFFYLFQEQS